MDLNGGFNQAQRPTGNEGKSTSIPGDFLEMEYEDSLEQNESSYNGEHYKRMIEDLEMRNGAVKKNISNNEERLKELKEKIKLLL